MPVALNTSVKSPYGVGIITAYREEDKVYTITLTQWVLSEGQKVHIYSQESQFTVVAEAPKIEEATAVVAEEKPEVVICSAAPVAVAVVEIAVVEVAIVTKKEAKLEVGAAVKTDYGVGVIQQIRESDSMYHIELTNWTLSEGQKVHIYCQANQLTLLDAEGATIIVAEAAIVVEEEHKVVTCTTPYGRGEIINFREEDKIYTIRLTSWVLTDNQPVHIYCTESGFTLDASEQETANKVVAEKKANVANKKEEAGCRCNIM